MVDFFTIKLEHYYSLIFNEKLIINNNLIIYNTKIQGNRNKTIYRFYKNYPIKITTDWSYNRFFLI
jgi:hypothetical protein